MVAVPLSYQLGNHGWCCCGRRGLDEPNLRRPVFITPPQVFFERPSALVASAFLFFSDGEKEKKLPRSPFLSPEKESYVIIPGPVMFSSSRRDPAHRTDPSPISFFFPTPHEQGVVIAELAREEGRERGGVRRGLVALSLCALHEQVLFAPPVRSRIRSHDVVQ